MSLGRRLLLRASRSRWLAQQLRRRAFFRRAVRRFLPGEDLGAALDAAAEFSRAGLGSVLTQLGEQVSNRAEAVAVRDHYLGVLAAVRQRRLPSQVSVKLTHLGLEVDRGACEQAVDALAEQLLQEAARGRARPVFGTHDLRLIAEIRERAERHATPRKAYEVHMLYGIKAAAQRALAADGYAVRVLISYGTAWFAWYMRRLAERPANLWFVVKNLL